jgi:hypothetical protein
VPLLRSASHTAYYVIKMNGVILGGRDLEQRASGLASDFSHGYGSVLDSGATCSPW